MNLMVIILILLLMIVVMMSMLRTAVPELRLLSIPLPGTKGSEAKLQVRCFSLCLTKLKWRQKNISRSCFLRVIETLTKLPSPQSFRCEQSSWPLTIIELGISYISYVLPYNVHLFAFRVLVSKPYIKTCKSQVCKTLFNVLSCWNSLRASVKKKSFVSALATPAFKAICFLLFDHRWAWNTSDIWCPPSIFFFYIFKPFGLEIYMRVRKN